MAHSGRTAPDEIQLWVTQNLRPGGVAVPQDPSLVEIEQLIAAGLVDLGGLAKVPLWIVGGEPTLRADLPEIIAAARDRAQGAVGLRCDGLALTRDAAIEPLVAQGLRRVRLPLHSVLARAHNWLVGIPGAWRRAVSATRRIVALDLGLEIEILVTRPTLSQLGETVALAQQLGASDLHLYRLTAANSGAGSCVGANATPHGFIESSARFGLLQPILKEAVDRAQNEGMRVHLYGFPSCVTPTWEPLRVVEDQILRLLPENDAWHRAGQWPWRTVAADACKLCPLLQTCGGAPVDYVEQFGWTEFRSHIAADDSIAISAKPGSIPSGRWGRAPVTRARDMQKPGSAKSRIPSSSGNRIGMDRIGIDRIGIDRIWVDLGGPRCIACESCNDTARQEPESTRSVRQRLVRAAQQGIRTLRIVGSGSFAHPKYVDLLEESSRLSFDCIEVVGEGTGLANIAEQDLERLVGIDQIDVPLFGPDARTHDAHVGRPGALEATLRGISRFAEGTSVRIGAFAVLHDVDHIAAFAAAWREGRLPGAPRFLLSRVGASLADLAQAAAALPSGESRDALLPLIPACLRLQDCPTPPRQHAGPAFCAGTIQQLPPSSIDPCGDFAPCRCRAPLADRCPGLAVGWDRTGVPA